MSGRGSTSAVSGWRGSRTPTLTSCREGMRQRAAFLRTVLADQEVFLLDEPFGALDALNRTQIHQWVTGLWESMRKTIILVTHDVDEAILLSDRVYVMTARPGTMKIGATCRSAQAAKRGRVFDLGVHGDEINASDLHKGRGH